MRISVVEAVGRHRLGHGRGEPLGKRGPIDPGVVEGANVAEVCALMRSRVIILEVSSG
jgi:hypothetical protein